MFHFLLLLLLVLLVHQEILVQPFHLWPDWQTHYRQLPAVVRPVLLTVTLLVLRLLVVVVPPAGQVVLWPGWRCPPWMLFAGQSAGLSAVPLLGRRLFAAQPAGPPELSAGLH